MVLDRVNVIDGRGGSPRLEQTVVIDGSVIAAIEPSGSLSFDESVRRIDLTGRTVIPGLIDFHAHATILPLDDSGRIAFEPNWRESETTLRILLAHGITTIRNPAAPTEAGVELRERVARRKILGPRIFTAGSPLNRTAAPFGPFVATPTVESVRAEVRRQAEQGVDFIKVYASLSPDLVGAAIDEAHRVGVKVIGHLQRTTWTEGAELGIDAIAHGAPWSVEYLSPADRSGYRGSFKDRMTWLERVDFEGAAVREMFALLAARGVVVDPTLIAYRTKFIGNDPMYEQRWTHPLVPPSAARIWRMTSFTADWTMADYGRGRSVWPRMLEMTKRMFESGVVLTAGSDFPNPSVVPGVSLHEELGLLVEAGIPPADVLQIATSNGAKALGIDRETGSLEVGKQADVVVLSGSPLEDIANIKKIELVLLGGRELVPSKLELGFGDSTGRPVDPVEAR